MGSVSMIREESLGFEDWGRGCMVQCLKAAHDRDKTKKPVWPPEPFTLKIMLLENEGHAGDI